VKPDPIQEEDPMRLNNRQIFSWSVLLSAIAAIALLAPGNAVARGKLKAVATTSIFGEILQAIGGDHVDVKVLQKPNRDVHFYEPTPSDIMKLFKADLFVHGGLDLEMWRLTLVDAARNRDVFPGGKGDVSAARGIALLEVPRTGFTRQEGDLHIYGNPHYWLDPANLGIIAENIEQGLSRVDPAHAADYERNLAAFQEKLDAAIPRWKAKLAPYAGDKLVAYHNAWPYFARAFSLHIDTFLEPKPNIPPSGSHLQTVVKEMREEKIGTILIEPFQHRPYAEKVASDTGAKVTLVTEFPGGLPHTEGLFTWMDTLTTTVANALGAKTGGAG
jgi:zinc/manganese transport system substrate-binding protein